MKRYNMIVVGAGPAGLSAAIEAKRGGMGDVAVFDENAKPGGQLFKQIHKFFGSKEHRAKVRGIRIGQDLLEEALELGVDVHLNAVVQGIYYPMRRIGVVEDNALTNYSADNIVVATGASENTVPFAGWTLPGVMGAGAAQTMMNLNGVMPGRRVLMVGSGNVGLVVGFQLLQAGCEVAAVIDAAPRIGGYGVHASKLARTGVPFYVSHTVVKAEGTDRVTAAVIAQVDEAFRPIPGTQQRLEVDTICMAVGLTPMSRLLAMTGCEMTERGGAVPVLDRCGMTSIPGLYAAGDVGGIEEASSAMITGRIAALSALYRGEYLPQGAYREQMEALQASLQKLRKGMFGEENKGKAVQDTDEGIPLSQTLLQRGYLEEPELERYPGASPRNGVYPVIECTQNIPCDPCQDACRAGCIQVGETITSLPAVNPGKRCNRCGQCVAACPGQAIFLVDETFDAFTPGFAAVTMPYEFLPLPQKGDRGQGLDRAGNPICEAEVVEVKAANVFDHTNLLTVQVPVEHAMGVRFFKKEAVFHE